MSDQEKFLLVENKNCVSLFFGSTSYTNLFYYDYRETYVFCSNKLYLFSILETNTRGVGTYEF